MKLRQIYVFETGGPKAMAFGAQYGGPDIDIPIRAYGPTEEKAIFDLILNHDLEFEE